MLRKFWFAGMTVALGVGAAQADIVYVDDSASGGAEDGSSWCDAYVTLQDALAAAGFWFRRHLEKSVPTLEGEIRLAGLAAPVTVERDALGVPTIRGQNRLDVSFNGSITPWMNLVGRVAQFQALICKISECFRRAQPSRRLVTVPGAGIGREATTMSTQKLEDRSFVELSGDVPEGHIDRSDGIGRHRTIHFPQALPDRSTIERITPKDGRFDKF